MNTEKDYLAKTPHILGLSIAIITIYSAIRLSIFYLFFNLNIFTYLELTEIIPQSLNAFIYALFIGIILYAGTSLLSTLIIEESVLKEMYTQPTFLKSVYLYPFLTLFILIYSGFITTILFLWVFGAVDGYLCLKVLFYFIITIFLVISFIEIHRAYYNRNGKILSRSIIMIVLFCIYSIIVSSTSAIEKKYLLKKDNLYLKNSVVVNNKMIKSTAAYYYIGKTNKYVFFYDENRDITDVYCIDSSSVLSVSE